LTYSVKLVTTDLRPFFKKPEHNAVDRISYLNFYCMEISHCYVEIIYRAMEIYFNVGHIFRVFVMDDGQRVKYG
jgi:hypothetical protein